jgi:hypothetical protein
MATRKANDPLADDLIQGHTYVRHKAAVRGGDLGGVAGRGAGRGRGSEPGRDFACLGELGESHRAAGKPLSNLRRTNSLPG